MPDLPLRTGGLLLLVGGAALAYVTIYQPIQSAQCGAECCSFSLKGSAFVPLLGLTLTVRGNQAGNLFCPRGRPSKSGWSACLGLFGVGVAFYFWVKATLIAHGYSFSDRPQPSLIDLAY